MNIRKEIYGNHKRIEFNLMWGNFQEMLERFTKGKKADIIAMTFHKRSFISKWVERSKVKDISWRMHTPFLIIEERTYERSSDLAEWTNLANSIA